MLNRRFQLLLDKDMWNNIVKSAKSDNISVGGYIRRTLIEYMDRKKEALIKEKPTTPFNRFFKKGGK